MENWIIRVDLPERNLKKAVSIDKNAPITDLLRILRQKIGDQQFMDRARIFLPSLDSSDIAYNASSTQGCWVFDESQPVESLFSPFSDDSDRVLQLRQCHLDSNRFHTTAVETPSSIPYSTSSSRRSSVSSGSVAQVKQSPHLQFDDSSLFQTLKKKHSLSKLGRMASKHLKQHMRVPSIQEHQHRMCFEWFGGYKLADIPTHPSTGIPIIIEKLLEYIEEHDLETEGIFRLSGGASSVAKVKEVFQLSNTGGIEIDLNDPEVPIDGHVAASLLKMFLRELPEPLLTNHLYCAWIAANETTSADLRLYWIYNLLKLLPREHYLLLNRLCNFFNHLASFGDVNKMTLQNLATIFGPNILRKESESPSQLVGNAAAVNTVALELVRSCEILFSASETLDNPGLYCLAKANFDFNANSEDLSFKVDDLFFVKTDENNDFQGWWTAEVLGKNSDSVISGFIPANYFEIIATFPSNQNLQRLPLDQLKLRTSSNMSRKTTIHVDDKNSVDAQTQTYESMEDFEQEIERLKRDNVQLRNEIIRLKSSLVLTECQQSEKRPHLRPQRPVSSIQLPTRPSNFNSESESQLSPTNITRRPKRAPPPAPPGGISYEVDQKRRSYYDLQPDQQSPVEILAETFDMQLQRVLARQTATIRNNNKGSVAEVLLQPRVSVLDMVTDLPPPITSPGSTPPLPFNFPPPPSSMPPKENGN